jgi:hypothetical protein
VTKVAVRLVYLKLQNAAIFQNSDFYEPEKQRLNELKLLKREKRDGAQNLEIAKLTASVKAEEARQEALQTQEGVKAFHRGIQVDYTEFMAHFHRNTSKISWMLMRYCCSYTE